MRRNQKTITNRAKKNWQGTTCENKHTPKNKWQGATRIKKKLFEETILFWQNTTSKKDIRQNTTCKDFKRFYRALIIYIISSKLLEAIIFFGKILWARRTFGRVLRTKIERLYSKGYWLKKLYSPYYIYDTGHQLLHCFGAAGYIFKAVGGCLHIYVYVYMYMYI